MNKITGSTYGSSSDGVNNNNNIIADAGATKTSTVGNTVITNANSPSLEIATTLLALKASVTDAPDQLHKIVQVSDSFKSEDNPADYASLVPEITIIEVLFTLGKKHLRPEFPPFAQERAVKLLEELVKNKHAKVALYLAKEYQLGRVFHLDLDCPIDPQKKDEDLKKAYELYQTAYKLGSKEASVEIALALCAGLGVKENPVLGMRYLEYAEQYQPKEACWELAKIYNDGLCGQTVDKEKAFLYYMKAYQNGAKGALLSCFHGVLKGIVIKKADPQGAVQLLKDGVEKDHNEALFLLGKEYLTGNDALKIKQDIILGIEYLDRAANRGNGHAANLLSEVYFSGQKVTKDLALVDKYIQLASRNNNWEAWLTRAFNHFKAGQNDDAQKCIDAIFDNRSLTTFDVMGAALTCLYQYQNITHALRFYHRGLLLSRNGLDDRITKRSSDAVFGCIEKIKNINLEKLEALEKKINKDFKEYEASACRIIDVQSDSAGLINRLEFKYDHITSSADLPELSALKSELEEALVNKVEENSEIKDSLYVVKEILYATRRQFQLFLNKMQQLKKNPRFFSPKEEKALEEVGKGLEEVKKEVQNHSKQHIIADLLHASRGEWVARSSEIDRLYQEKVSKQQKIDGLKEQIRSWNDKIETQAQQKRMSIQATIEQKHKETRSVDRQIEDYVKRVAVFEGQIDSDQGISEEQLQDFNQRNHNLLRTLEPAVSPSTAPPKDGDPQSHMESLRRELQSVKLTLKDKESELHTMQNTLSRQEDKHGETLQKTTAKYEILLQQEREKNKDLSEELEPFKKVLREQKKTTNVVELIKLVNERIQVLKEKRVYYVGNYKLETIEGKITGNSVKDLYLALGFTYRNGDHHNFERGQGFEHKKVTMVSHDLSHEVNDEAKQEALNILLSDLTF